MTDERTPPSGFDAPQWTALAAKREAVAAVWAELACKEYPLGIAGFSRSGGDAFADPVGERTRRAAEAFSRAITSPLPSPEEAQELDAAVEELMRVRAVQSMSPETALGIFPAMKTIIRSFLLGDTPSNTRRKSGAADAQEYPAIFFTLDSRIDAVTLAAFGQYCRCRERIAEITLREHTRLASRPPHARGERFIQEAGEAKI